MNPIKNHPTRLDKLIHHELIDLTDLPILNRTPDSFNSICKNRHDLISQILRPLFTLFSMRIRFVIVHLGLNNTANTLQPTSDQTGEFVQSIGINFLQRLHALGDVFQDMLFRNCEKIVNGRDLVDSSC